MAENNKKPGSQNSGKSGSTGSGSNRSNLNKGGQSGSNVNRGLGQDEDLKRTSSKGRLSGEQNLDEEERGINRSGRSSGLNKGSNKDLNKGNKRQ